MPKLYKRISVLTLGETQLDIHLVAIPDASALTIETKILRHGLSELGEVEIVLCDALRPLEGITASMLLQRASQLRIDPLLHQSFSKAQNDNFIRAQKETNVEQVHSCWVLDHLLLLQRFNNSLATFQHNIVSQDTTRQWCRREHGVLG